MAEEMRRYRTTNPTIFSREKVTLMTRSHHAQRIYESNGINLIALCKWHGSTLSVTLSLVPTPVLALLLKDELFQSLLLKMRVTLLFQMVL